MYINRDYSNVCRKRRGFLFALKKEIKRVAPDAKMNIRNDVCFIDGVKSDWGENEQFLMEGVDGIKKLSVKWKQNLNINFNFEKNF
jgi:hypothetical protein